MIKETLVGIFIAVVIFLSARGLNVLPIILMLALSTLLFFMLRSRGGSPISTGSRETATSHKIEFTNIGGQDAAKRELMEALDFLRFREKIQSLGIRPLKGILLTGPPGTGKTMMAKAAATYTDSVFVSASGSEFVEMYVGVGASRVRELFRKARMIAKKENKDSAIVFIDEIDVVGGKRGGGQGHQEYDQTLNQLLTEMDGMQTTVNPMVLVVAATNRIDILDSALLRPGRFDRQIRVDLPDKDGRLSILQIQTQNKPLADDVDLEIIARESFGFSGAELESLCNEAAIQALREDRERLELRHFRDAVDKVLMGEKTGKKPSAEELERVAVHEVGHAIAMEIANSGSVAHITIAPRGQALGFVRQVPEIDSYLYTKDQLEKQIRVALAGSCAEGLTYSERSTGANGDIAQASQLARTLVMSGLSSLKFVDPETLQQEVLDQEVRKILQEQNELTYQMLLPYQAALREFALVLVEKETVSGERFRSWIAEVRPIVTEAIA
ncbi:MAG: ATPase [Bacilli bacterium]|nr:ATPase [Bacilli bacterium]